ncbi:PINIT domain-containing protein [Echria macrotheca]|uniref:PINIT domain-containing protein n=1 Tax=Echria macrotheca TaxID=438768 RepID=A0AAJ0B5T7_9PEZI|nr:PINIT domain-containing protein [Echria macrotheca]
MDLESPSKAELEALIRTIYKPSKPKLQAICSVNGLPKTGNKADLHGRLIELINESVRNRDLKRYNEIRESVYKEAGLVPAMASAPYVPVRGNPIPTSHQQRYAAPTTFAPAPAFALSNGSRPNPALTLQQASLNASMGYDRSPAQIAPGFQFKASPFYEAKERLGEVKICEVMESHRHSVTFNVRASEILGYANNPSMRVMVFCAAGNTGVQEIAFPHQCELKVNGGEVKANMRGLKNKPGSTRPPDITDLLRLKPSNYNNTVEFTYALTNKKFYLLLVLCKAISVSKLVENIEKKIRKESVIAELTKKADDPDIEATSLNLSLKCPLSYSRLKNPCRAIGCSHIQCFDATSYLQLQEQGPQWVCPICNKPAPYEQLAVDEYVREIVRSTSDSVEQVTIDPYGKWTEPGAKNETKKEPRVAALLDDDFVISSPSAPYNRNGFSSSATPSRGPPSSVYLGGTAVGTSQNTPESGRSSSKRPAPEVIDLTLSDDDDQPPPKRVQYDHYGPPY